MDKQVWQSGFGGGPCFQCLHTGRLEQLLCFCIFVVGQCSQEGSPCHGKAVQEAGTVEYVRALLSISSIVDAARAGEQVQRAPVLWCGLCVWQQPQLHSAASLLVVL